MSRQTPDDYDATAIDRLINAALLYRQSYPDVGPEVTKALTAAAMRMPDPDELPIRCPGKLGRGAGRDPLEFWAVRTEDGKYHPLEPEDWGWACECGPDPWRGRGAPKGRQYGCAGPAVLSHTVRGRDRCSPGHWYWPLYIDMPASQKGKPIPAEWTRTERAPAWWVRARLWEQQKGMCAVCQERPGQVLDHDHDTGMARGLLCRSCNVQEGQCANGIVHCPAAEDRPKRCFPEYRADPPARSFAWLHDRHSTTLARMLDDVCGTRCPGVARQQLGREDG